MLIYNSLADALHRLHPMQGIMQRTAVFGGDINRCSVLHLSDGADLFLKENSGKGSDFFKAEALGLSALKSACKGTALNVPEVIAFGDDFLLMENINQGASTKEYWEKLGRGLAMMHKADTSRFCSGCSYGFFADNYIGETDQINTPNNSWIEFFRDFRLVPMLAKVSRHFEREDIACAERLLSRLGSFLPDNPSPSLLHGDLWSGNTMAGENGSPWIFDPAVYVGDRECDLAMTELFGEFPKVFYNAYNEVYPLDMGYARRRELYNLYHLLNHLNLFGESYLPSVLNTIRKF